MLEGGNPNSRLSATGTKQRSMAPPPFQLDASPVQAKSDPVQAKSDSVQTKSDPVQMKADPSQSSQPPIQRKESPVQLSQAVVQREEGGEGGDRPENVDFFRTFGGSDKPNDALKARGNRGGASREFGNQNVKPISPQGNIRNIGQEGLTNNSAVSVNGKKGTEQEIAPGVKVVSTAEATGNLGLGGAGVSGEARRGVDFEWTFPRDYKFNLLGEDTTIGLEFIVGGMCGAEALAGLEAHFKRTLYTKDPRTMTEDDVFKGLDAKAEAFVGVKVAVKAHGKYFWEKKSGNDYKAKIMNAIGPIKNNLKAQRGFWGGAAHLIPDSQLVGIICGILFGKGGTTILGGVGAKIEGSAGVGAEGAFHARFVNGEIQFKASAGATWGLGFGTGVEVGLNLVQGVLFGLVTAGNAGAEAVGLTQKIMPHAMALMSDNAFIMRAIEFVNSHPLVYDALVKVAEMTGLKPQTVPNID